MDRTQAQFVQLLVENQARIEAFVRSLVMDVNIAQDIVQQTNLVLWEKAGEYDELREFGPWACGIAYFEVLTYRKRFAREREKLVFDEEQLQRIAAAATRHVSDMEDRQAALQACLEKLPKKYRLLLRERYESGRGIAEIAESLRRPAGSIRQTLFRIRLMLLDCIRNAQVAGANKSA